jgi:site-specific DNA recombinase
VPRVPAPEIEGLVLRALREHLGAADGQNNPASTHNRVLIERQLDRVVIKAQELEIHFAGSGRQEISTEKCQATGQPGTSVVVPWSPTRVAEIKGILHPPLPHTTVSSSTRDSLLGAIARARIWMEEIVQGRVVSFAQIAEREGKVERHIRLLAPLAFVSPRIISEMIDGPIPTGLTVTGLAKGLAYSWAEQGTDLFRLPRRFKSCARSKIGQSDQAVTPGMLERALAFWPTRSTNSGPAGQRAD